MGSYSDNTPAIHDLAQKMISNSMIDTSLYSKYNVKRGLRDLDGKGVLTGHYRYFHNYQNKEVMVSLFLATVSCIIADIM